MNEKYEQTSEGCDERELDLGHLDLQALASAFLQPAGGIGEPRMAGDLVKIFK